MADEKDIGSEYTDLLADFAKGTVDNSSVEVVDLNAEKPDATGAEGEKPEEVVEAAETPKAEEVAKDEKKEEVAEKVNDEEPKELEPFSDWDTQEEKAVEADKAKEAVPDVKLYEDLGKVLGAEVKSKEELVAALTAINAKTIGFENAPAELKKAIELASKGADYLEYLKVNTVDYKSVDPVELYEDYIIDQAADENGNVDEEKVTEYLDSLSDFEKRLRGVDLQKRLQSEQIRRTAELEQEAIRSREKHDSELRSALMGFKEIDGFVVSDSHRRELFDWISTGKITKDLFYNADGQFDATKAAKVAFRNKYYDKLDAYQKTKIRNSTKREIIKDITNQEIVSTPKFANPEPTKGYGAEDYIRSLEENFGIK